MRKDKGSASKSCCRFSSISSSLSSAMRSWTAASRAVKPWPSGRVSTAKDQVGDGGERVAFTRARPVVFRAARTFPFQVRQKSFVEPKHAIVLKANECQRSLRRKTRKNPTLPIRLPKNSIAARWQLRVPAEFVFFLGYQPRRSRRRSRAAPSLDAVEPTCSPCRTWKFPRSALMYFARLVLLNFIIHYTDSIYYCPPHRNLDLCANS